jgi:hypothetical protein
MHLQLTRLLLISILALSQPQDSLKPSPNSDPQKAQDSAASTAPATPTSAGRLISPLLPPNSSK